MSNYCAYDRVSMLAGQTATQQCVSDATGYGGQPANLDGKIPPPRGEPGYFVRLDQTQNQGVFTFTNQLDLWTFHVDWKNPANSKLTGPTQLPVASFTQPCGVGVACIATQGGNGVPALDDRLMFRLSYRNFGTHESLFVNHTVAAGSTSGVRWYEIRSPNGTPTLYQQSTYGPADSNYRWMGSLAEDQAEDMALGFSIASATSNPAIGWTGRLGSDAIDNMTQAEAVIDTGSSTETSAGTPRWGDYSNMTVDPVDDCTFWYTQELYNNSDEFLWDTYIASVKFPNCAANDFTIALTPATETLYVGQTNTYQVATTLAAGTAESIALNLQDLPPGVTAAFSPAKVNAGTPSTLTLTAAKTAPVTSSPVTFTTIGKAPSAVHAATAAVNVQICTPLTKCPAPDDCGQISDGCNGQVSCGGPCTAPESCGGGGQKNVCGCTPATHCTGGQTCGTAADGCGKQISCGTCGAGQTCAGTTCVAIPQQDAGGSPSDNGNTNSNSGCGCRTAGAGDAWPTSAWLGVGGLALASMLRLRRRRSRSD